MGAGGGGASQGGWLQGAPSLLSQLCLASVKFGVDSS